MIPAMQAIVEALELEDSKEVIRPTYVLEWLKDGKEYTKEYDKATEAYQHLDTVWDDSETQEFRMFRVYPFKEPLEIASVVRSE